MKYLIIQFYQIGDLVLTTQIPHIIKNHDSDAEIHFLTFSMNKELLQFNPYINEVITFSRKDGLIAYLKLIWKIRKEKYDVIFDFQDTPRSAKIVFFSGAEKRVTYENTRRKYAYNSLAPYLRGTATDIKMSLPSHFFGKSFSITQENKRPEIYTSQEWDNDADKILLSMGYSEDDFIITIAPTHKRETRRWKREFYLDLAKHLTETYGAKVIITFGPGEREYVTEVFKENDSLKLMPETHLGIFAAMLKKVKLHIGNDSAPHHIATAVKTPTFIILGSSNNGWVFPSEYHTWINKGLPCQPCKKAVCRISKDIPCMSELAPHEVAEALDKFIKKVINI